ncbi:hypothetical protein [Bdellovibrio reynosensis]|uniref:Uncharacterized protein n=1 Tax=Bdellovibrio reynosensis TaxID=2835041 RepID=A0ABY4C6N1_9BACT|nr:hypothetical protein [Bdellovibrio reynosensis]UOF00637.1 hypothetical protein MNR06_13115 [Bdellovibrio reynosensis]
MKNLVGLFVLGALFSVQTAGAANFPKCSVILKDKSGISETTIELALVMYPKSDLAAYVYHGTVGSFDINVSTCDGTYNAFITGKNGTKSSVSTETSFKLGLALPSESIQVSCNQ